MSSRKGPLFKEKDKRVKASSKDKTKQKSKMSQKQFKNNVTGMGCVSSSKKFPNKICFI